MSTNPLSVNETSANVTPRTPDSVMTAATSGVAGGGGGVGSGGLGPEFQVDYDNVSPDMPTWVFESACVALAAIGAFGILANSTVFVLFFITPMVRRELQVNGGRHDCIYARVFKFAYSFSP